MPDSIRFDNATQFGYALFETIAVRKGKPLFCDKHLERLENSMDALGIHNPSYVRQSITAEIERRAAAKDNHAIKVWVSEENIVFTERPVPYTPKQYTDGFSVCGSDVRRNETSPFTYHKCLQNGDLLYEKKKAAARGYDEVIFLNTQGQVCEGAVSNIFIVKDGTLITPPIQAGILNGVIRQFILDSFSHTSCENVSLDDVYNADEVFLTNSLMGIMPVARIGTTTYTQRTHTQQLLNWYAEIR